MREAHAGITKTVAVFNEQYFADLRVGQHGVISGRKRNPDVTDIADLIRAGRSKEEIARQIKMKPSMLTTKYKSAKRRISRDDRKRS